MSALWVRLQGTRHVSLTEESGQTRRNEPCAGHVRFSPMNGRTSVGATRSGMCQEETHALQQITGSCPVSSHGREATR
jgi:hypothetical protein